MSEVSSNDCSKCNEKILNVEDALTCSTCKKNNHFYCLGMTERGFRKITKDVGKKWTCNTCSQAQQAPKINKDVQLGVEGIREIVKEIMAENTKIYIEKIEEVKTTIGIQIQDFISTVNFISDKYDKLILELDDNKKQNEKLKKAYIELENQNKQLTNTIQEIKTKLMEKEIEIIGIPEVQGESLEQIVKEIAGALQIPEGSMPINKPKRTNYGKPNLKNIIFTTESKEDRDIWIKKARENKTKLTTDSLKIGSSKRAIYINESLPAEVKKLLYNIKNIKAELNIKYVWIKEGKIMIRKDDAAPIYRIKQLEDIEKLKEQSKI